MASIHQQCQDEKNKKLLIHCKGGTGRTGAMIASLLAREPQYKSLGFDGALDAYTNLRARAKFGSATEEQSQRDSAKKTFESLSNPPLSSQENVNNISADKKNFLDSFSEENKAIQLQQNLILTNNPNFIKFDNPIIVGSIIDSFSKGDIDQIKKIAERNKGIYNSKTNEITLTREKGNITFNLQDIAKLAELSRKMEELYKCNNSDDLNIMKENDKAVIQQPTLAELGTTPPIAINPPLSGNNTKGLEDRLALLLRPHPELLSLKQLPKLPEAPTQSGEGREWYTPQKNSSKVLNKLESGEGKKPIIFSEEIKINALTDFASNNHIHRSIANTFDQNSPIRQTFEQLISTNVNITDNDRVNLIDQLDGEIRSLSTTIPDSPTQKTLEKINKQLNTLREGLGLEKNPHPLPHQEVKANTSSKRKM